MSATVQEYEHAGMTVQISYDTEPEFSDPRSFDGNVGVMLCGHRRYRLGDEQIETLDTSVMCPTCNGSGEHPERVEIQRFLGYGWVVIAAGTVASMEGELARITAAAAYQAARESGERAGIVRIEACQCPRCEGRGEVELPLAAYLKQERGATVILPLGLIDHSGISMYVGAGAHPHDPGGWDSGQVGVIFDTTETREQLQDTTREEIEKRLRAEVDTYAEYLRGEVYCYTVTGPDGEHIDSCGGFLGDLEYVTAQANEAAQQGLRAARRERREASLMACRGIMTV